jgi:hypothetical protein
MSKIDRMKIIPESEMIKGGSMPKPGGRDAVIPGSKKNKYAVVSVIGNVGAEGAKFPRDGEYYVDWLLNSSV